MKKLAIITILAATSIAASATDFGVRIGRNDSTETNNAGITVGQKVGKFGVEAAYDRMVVGNDNTRYSLVGTFDFAKFGAATLTSKAGLAYIEPRAGETGYAGLIGVGASYALTKDVSLTADYAYQKGQDRMVAQNGNIYSVGVKYSF